MTSRVDYPIWLNYLSSREIDLIKIYGSVSSVPHLNISLLLPSFVRFFSSHIFFLEIKRGNIIRLGDT